MKIRLTGTRDKCATAADALAAVLTVREVSEFYPNRGTSVLGRVYLDAELHPAAETRAVDAARPGVVVLCGSAQFPPEMAQAAREETVAGRIVLRPECDLKTPDPLWPTERLDEVKTRLDELHRAKIRLADEVLIVAPEGCVGDSTRAEIDYTAEVGCPVRYWPDRYWPGEVRA